MVAMSVVKETVKGCLKVYVRDAAIAYSTAFIGGCMAGAAYIGLKDGINCGKDIAKGGKKLVGKVFTKKPKKEIPASASEANVEKPEEPNQE